MHFKWNYAIALECSHIYLSCITENYLSIKYRYSFKALNLTLTYLSALQTGVEGSLVVPNDISIPKIIFQLLCYIKKSLTLHLKHFLDLFSIYLYIESRE